MFACADVRKARNNVLRKQRMYCFLRLFVRMPAFFYRKLGMYNGSIPFIHNNITNTRNVRWSMLQSAVLSKGNVATDVTHTWLRQYVFLFAVLLRRYAFFYTRFEYTLSDICSSVAFLESDSLSAKVCFLRSYPKTHVFFLSYVASLLFSTISSMWQNIHSYFFFLNKASGLRMLTKHPDNAYNVVSDAVINKFASFFFIRLRISLLQFCFVDLSNVNMYSLFVASFKNAFYFIFNTYCTTKCSLQRYNVTRLCLHSEYVNWLRIIFFTSYNRMVQSKYSFSLCKSFILNSRAAFPDYFKRNAQLM